MRLRTDERGYTLAEMLMATLLLMVILAAVVQISTVVQRNEPEIRERAGQIQQARALMERIGRELRQSYAVRGVTPTSLTFDAYVHRVACGGAAATDTSPAIPCSVRYSCTTAACSRAEGPPGGSPANPVVLAEGLENTTPFAPAPAADPEYIEVTIVLPAAGGDDAITLRDGITLRNEAEVS